MARHSFKHVKTELSPLWDYGWFDLSRFDVTSPQGTDSSTIVADFVSDPVFRRSFCESPDPWGRELDRHGPFLCHRFSHEWYIPTDFASLATDVDDAIRDTKLEPDPSDEQLAPLRDWIAITQDADVWRLKPPDDDVVRVDWAHIWFAFEEFLAYYRRTSELYVAVIGYD